MIFMRLPLYLAILAARMLEVAERHVLDGRRIVLRQRRLVAALTPERQMHREAVSLLHQFERSLAIFEDDLAVLKQQAALRGASS
jgi:hypothetical protein